MFNNTVSVISNISRSLKKYLFIFGIITQILFIAYYVFLLVTSLHSIHLTVLYAFVLFFALVLFFVDVLTLDLTDFKTKLIKAKFVKIITIISWLFKTGVIGFNIYFVVTTNASDASIIFLIFTGVFLLIQILSSLIGWLFGKYIELLMYSLKMDYEELLDADVNPNEKPIGQALYKVTNHQNHKEEVQEIAMKYELYGSIKDELNKNKEIRIKGKLVKRRKAEKVILRYYREATLYYVSPKKIRQLCEAVTNNLFRYIRYNDKAFLLEFFLQNYYEKVYVGLSEYSIKLIIACFLFMLDDTSKDFTDIIHKAILKEIIDIKSWSELNNKPNEEHLGQEKVVPLKYEKALGIAKEIKDQYELYKEETIGSEFESLIFKVIKNAVIENGKLTFRRKVRSFFKKDR